MVGSKRQSGDKHGFGHVEFVLMGNPGILIGIPRRYLGRQVWILGDLVDLRCESKDPAGESTQWNGCEWGNFTEF